MTKHKVLFISDDAVDTPLPDFMDNLLRIIETVPEHCRKSARVTLTHEWDSQEPYYLEWDEKP